MPVAHHSTVRAIALLLLLACVTQGVYTALYVAKLEVPRQLLWGTEGLLFPLLAALAGAAMVRTERLTLAFAAIAFAAVLNLVQVGVGLTLFFPFAAAAKADPALAPAAGAIVAFAFVIYNAAKLLLGLAALLVGLARMAAGRKALGGATALAGGIAMLANGAAIAAGGKVFGELPLAGGTGVLATALLAACLLGAARED
ncbi:thiamine biosynthesis protein ThiC [Erythrobacter oryzae]|uniref:thiamine biosynthesis protein ThiC n=1 Tax=Erythrobacter oryzae TaxID=3019556 RepID=UPI002553E070|nr:thiamine biosynthesis protein ThiC [Erythrobacter sp. COR-2]